MCSLFDYGEPLKDLNYLSYEINCVNLFQDETSSNKKAINKLTAFFNFFYNYCYKAATSSAGAISTLP